MKFWNRAIRYGVVGIAVSAIYSLLVVLLIDRGHLASATLASVLAFAAVLPLAYAAHRRVTFSDAVPDPVASLRFVITTAASFFVAAGTMYLATGVFAGSYLIGIALNWVLIPAMNFLIYLVWVFRAGSVPPDQARLVSTAPAVGDRVRGGR